jgi:hypothetical protein
MNDDERISNEVRRAMRGVARDSFAPGFADRAAARWKAERASGGFAPAVVLQFRRLVPLAAAAALVLTVWNLRHPVPAAQPVATPVAAQVTLGSLYGLDEMGGH